MTDIFLDASLATSPDAGGHVAHLIDAGQRVVIVGPAAAGSTRLSELERLDRVPESAGRGSWFVTAEPALCAEQPAGVRTLLVGPRVGPGPFRAPGCDAGARDLAAAVLEILAHDAMGGGQG
jgi:hypothetical protein